VGAHFTTSTRSAVGEAVTLAVRDCDPINSPGWFRPTLQAASRARAGRQVSASKTVRRDNAFSKLKVIKHTERSPAIPSRLINKEIEMKKTLAILISIVLLCVVTVSSQPQATSKEKIAKETIQFVSQGSAAYLKQDYQKSIQFYSKALELEKKEPTLERNIWRVLVDNLGMSYGISGNNKKAKEIFEYGLSKDEQYPMFYYNLACAYAELNDLDNAITNLERAFEYKENMIRGERIPNPATDDSFSRFLKNEKFRRVLDELSSK
jgi:tetratricopeptide (TPR) repeat protein